MDLIEKQKEKLRELAANVRQYEAFGMNSDAYLTALRMICIRAAKIVHEGRLDLAGKSYIQHPMRVAAKATNIVGFCVAILHDAVEDGKELGFTLDFLRNELLLPEVIVAGVDAITRREGETYGDYLRRVADNFTAAKAKLEDNKDNSDVTRFDKPTKQDQIRCAGYLDKAYTLKSNPTFQLDMIYDIIQGVTELHKVVPLVYVPDERHMDETVIYQRIYIGVEGLLDRRLTVIFNGAINPEGKVKMAVTTYPSKLDYADYQIYTPRRTMLEFASRAAAMDYLGNSFVILNATGLKVADDPHNLISSPMAMAAQEKKFVDAIGMFYA